MKIQAIYNNHNIEVIKIYTISKIFIQNIKIPIDKTYTNVEEIGNTGSASIGIALSEAVDLGKVKSGQKVLLAGVGAGFNFGANIWQF